MSVRPTTVLVDGANASDHVDNAGALSTEASEGDHMCEVQLRGYRDLQLRATAGTQAPTFVVLLDPATPAERFGQKSVTARLSRQPAGSALVSGYVADSVSGAALPGASVTLEGTPAATTTDVDGFYSLAAGPVANSKAVADDPPGRRCSRLTLRISASGYGTLTHENLAFVSGESLINNVRLQPGRDAVIVDESDKRENAASQLVDDRLTVKDDRPTAAPASGVTTTAAATRTLQAPPNSIRVGSSCSCTACSSVLVMSIDTYTKHVLPAEWFTTWTSDSLKAGAIAIRSYGGWYVYHPQNANYDICNNTCCQVYGSSTSTNPSAAVDATTGIYIVDASGNVARTEYSAENNDNGNRDGCGNCSTLDNPSDGLCLSDSVCCGFTQNGHGRGMCQWGTQRWSINQGKTYDWICDHYFSAYNYSRANLLAPRSAPAGVQASDALFSDKVQVTWSTQAEATSYNVYRATVNSFGSASFIWATSATSFDDTSVTPDTSYWYWIEPTNAYGAGPVSTSDSGSRSSVSNVGQWRKM